MREINTQSDKKKDKKIDIISLLRFYSTKWKYILVSVIVFMILGGIYAYTKSPIYEVQANVLITDNDTKSDFLRSFSMADVFGGKSSVDDEIAIMYSHSLFSDIVKEFQLNKTYIVKENLLKKSVSTITLRFTSNFLSYYRILFRSRSFLSLPLQRMARLISQ